MRVGEQLAVVDAKHCEGRKRFWAWLLNGKVMNESTYMQSYAESMLNFSWINVEVASKSLIASIALEF
jgi:hypothetical protein